MIRLANADDAPQIAAIYRPFCLDNCVSFETGAPDAAEMAARVGRINRRYAWLVDDAGGIIRGYAYASPHRERAAYRWAVEVTVYVHESHRGEGVGRALYADLFGIVGAERQRLTVDLLRMTRMEPFRSRQAGRLSGGMKQKLALMCTLLHHPQILFLDEPTNGVDPVSRRDFWAILYQLLKDGITIFMTTAYLDEAERCNRVGLMHKGKLIRCSAPDVMKQETGSVNLEGAFIKTIQMVDEQAARP